MIYQAVLRWSYINVEETDAGTPHLRSQTSLPFWNGAVSRNSDQKSHSGHFCIHQLLRRHLNVLANSLLVINSLANFGDSQTESNDDINPHCMSCVICGKWTFREVCWG